MTRFLFAWELGANYGHLARDIPVAIKLRNKGHQVLFAVRDTKAAAELLGRQCFPYVQAPFCITPPRLARPPANYAELLVAEGWGSPLTLLGMVKAWLTLYTLTRCDVVIADHAPTALLAAHVDDLKRFALGSGFEIPPAETPFPSIRPWEQHAAEQLVNSENRVLAIANQVCKSLSVIPLRTLLELFPSQPLLTTFPELDPYPSRNKGIYLGSIHGVGQAADIRWPTEAERKAMVYLRPAHQCCIPVLSALTESGITAICAIPGINEAQIKKYESPLLKVVAHPVEFSELGRQSGLTLCHGGAGTIAQSLLAGVPLLLIPTTVEQYLNAKRVESLGAGILLEPGTDKKGVSVAMEHILTNPQYRKSAKEFALRHLADTPEDSAERAANAILNKDLGIAVGQEVDRGHSSYTGMKRDALH